MTEVALVNRHRSLVSVPLAMLAAALMLLICLAVPPRASAAYPGANGKIAFTRANQIYSINSGGGGLEKLTTSPKNYWPRWSPNGKRIAFIHETATGSKDIWVMNANGSNKQQVTHLGNVLAPAWSPDGATLAFGGGAPGDLANLMRISSTAPFGSPTLMIGNFSNPAFPEPIVVEGGAAWDPNGQFIFFFSTRYPSSPDYYILQYNVATTEVTAWLASGGACCGPGIIGQPVVSANGARIGYTYTDGAPRIRLSGFPTFGSITFATQPQDEQLAFSPNGGKVAFMNDANGTARIFTANANGSGRKVLTNGYQPDWQVKP